MYPGGNTCHTCLCTNTFDNKLSVADNPDCHKIDCGIELDLGKFKSGCVPVYFEKPNCCPIETKCRKSSEISDVFNV